MYKGITYIDENEKEFEFGTQEEFLEFLKLNDKELYKIILDEIVTADDYNGKDIGSATAEAIEIQNNNL